MAENRYSDRALGDFSRIAGILFADGGMTPDQIIEWFDSPVPGFEDRTPAHLIETGKTDLIDRMFGWLAAEITS